MSVGYSRPVSDESRHKIPTTTVQHALELGIFLGAKRYGGAKQARKSCLILDREQYRYQIFCSDIAGQDIRAHHNRAHHNDVGQAIAAVRDWLRINHPGSIGIPGAKRMQERYVQFRLELPAVARAANLDVQELNFLDYRTSVTGWLDENS